jgi:hypothetical protein
MTNLQNLTVKQLRKVVAIKEEIESLNAQLASIAGAEMPASAAENAPKRRRRRMSAAARAAIGAAQRRRWAKVKGGKAAKPEKAVKKKRKVSAATRVRLAAAAKARWARAKAAGESTL